MQFVDLVEEIVTTKCFTPVVENQLTQTLQSQPLNEQDTDALEELLKVLSDYSLRWVN